MHAKATARKKRILLAGLCLVLIPVSTGGGIARAAHDPRHIPGYPLELEAFDAREIAMLPTYCKHTQVFRDRVPGGNNPNEVKRWYDLQGPTFNAMHHYCMGLMNTNRALLLATNSHTKAVYLRGSILEFDYVIKHATQDFILLPEILTKKGENLIRMDEGHVGAAELLRAIDLKPDYWPPYAALSDYYKQTGESERAQDLLRKALSFAPQVAGLKRRLAELERTKSK